ncbi:MAG: glycosyltransferase family 2 protein [Caldilineaceae bacterium]
MNNKPFISIIIPTYNAEESIRPCLNAVFSSAYSPVEVIVVDDGSKDKTCQIVAEYGVSVIQQEINKGQGAARNLGSQVSRGDILLFIDSDIVVNRDTLKLIAEYMHAYPHVSAITGTLSKQHPNENFFSQYKNLYMNAIFSRVQRNVDFIFGSIFVVRRGDYLQMEESRILAEDTELGFRMSLAGKKIHLLHHLEVVHLKHYNLKSLVINDFQIPYYFGKLFVRYWNPHDFFKKRTFSHTSKTQILSVIGMPLIFTGLALTPFSQFVGVGALCMLLIPTYFNRDLYKLYFERGLLFGAGALIFSYIDMLIMALGTYYGIVSEILTKLYRKPVTGTLKL